MSKGSDTRNAILHEAIRLASQAGLDGLSIGGLSAEVGMSKSGLFAHFGSKEKLQLAVVQAAAAQFAEQIVRPALRSPRGEPRVRALVDNWSTWARSSELPGGCLFVQLTAELDDKPGPVRDLVVSLQQDWLNILAEAARRAQAEGHFRATLDPEQFAFTLHSLMLGYHHADRLLRDPRAPERLTSAVDELLATSRG